MKILFVTLTNIGDVVISTALLQRVLKTYPDAVVDVVVGPQSTAVFEGLPNLGKLIPLKKKKRHMHYIDLWKQLRHEKYDIIIDLRTPFLTWFLNGKKKIKFKATEKEHRAIQCAKLWPSDDEPSLTAWVKDETTKKVEQQFAEKVPSGSTVIAICPTANWIGKQWPQSGFNKVVQMIEQEKSVKKPFYLVFGGPGEQPMVQDLLDSIPKQKRLNLIGKTSIAEAFVWLKKSDCVIGNDSGLSHLAAAAGTKGLTLFGPSKDHIYAPFNKSSKIITAPLRKRKDTNLSKKVPPRLMTDITPKMVFNEFKELLIKR